MLSGPNRRFTEQQIRDAIDRAGTVQGAAVLLGVHRKTVWEYLKRYGIKWRKTAA